MELEVLLEDFLNLEKKLGFFSIVGERGTVEVFTEVCEVGGLSL